MKIKNYLFGFIAICAVGFSVPAIAYHIIDTEDGPENIIKNVIKMAKQGDAKAQNYLGVLYEYGHGVKQSEKTALLWFRKSAIQGNAIGQTQLGRMYSMGKGVAKNYTTAVQWYRKAAKQGYAGAQSMLGLMYNTGRVGPKDNIRSYMWYSLESLKDGNMEDMDDIAKKMTSTEIEQAKKLVRTCLNSNYQDCGL